MWTLPDYAGPASMLFTADIASYSTYPLSAGLKLEKRKYSLVLVIAGHKTPMNEEMTLAKPSPLQIGLYMCKTLFFAFPKHA